MQRANLTEVVVRGLFSVVITEEKQVQRHPSVFFNIFSFLFILLKNFVILLEFLFFRFSFFQEGLGVNWKKEKHLICFSLTLHFALLLRHKYYLKSHNILHNGYL